MKVLDNLAALLWIISTSKHGFGHVTNTDRNIQLCMHVGLPIINRFVFIRRYIELL